MDIACGDSMEYFAIPYRRSWAGGERDWRWMKESRARPARLESPALKKAWDAYFAIDTSEANDDLRKRALAKVRRIMEGRSNGEPVSSPDVLVELDSGASAGDMGEVAPASRRGGVNASSGA